MRTLHIINGPNLNMLGIREVELYGKNAFEDYLERLRVVYPNDRIIYYQSNHEGDLIDYLQTEARVSDGVVINAGALTHYSYAIADALVMVESPIIEVHITNIYEREAFRHKSVLSPYVTGVIAGLGLDVYRLAIAHLLSRKS